MRLIGLAVALAVSLSLAPGAAEARQPAEKVYRVGWIVSSPTATPHLQAAFRLSLSERGINLKTAKALGLTVPPLVRLQAEQVID
jgi:ABC-type nitrate/sulfonate/bicarbonate transport system substrate-binding protein